MYTPLFLWGNKSSSFNLTSFYLQFLPCSTKFLRYIFQFSRLDVLMGKYCMLCEEATVILERKMGVLL